MKESAGYLWLGLQGTVIYPETSYLRKRLYKSSVRHITVLHLSYLGLVNTWFFNFSGLAFKGKVPESP